MKEKKEKKVAEKKGRVFKTTEIGDLQKYSAAMVQQKVYFIISAKENRAGTITYTFVTVPITDAKRKAILTTINKM